MEACTIELEELSLLFVKAFHQLIELVGCCGIMECDKRTDSQNDYVEASRTTYCFDVSAEVTQAAPYHA